MIVTDCEIVSSTTRASLLSYVFVYHADGMVDDHDSLHRPITVQTVVSWRSMVVEWSHTHLNHITRGGVQQSPYDWKHLHRKEP